MSENNKRNRRFVLTVNNYNDGDIECFRTFVSRPGRKYCCFQRERGSNGTDHLQGYVVFGDKVARSVVASIWPRAHIEVARGTEDQCVAYCSKVDDTSVPGTFEEFGQRGVGQGARTDVHSFVKAIADGKSGRDLLEEFPEEFLRYNGGCNIMRIYAKRRDFKTQVYWLWGGTGTGKSRWANFQYPEAYWKSPVHKWWDGYDPRSHDAIIIDDFRRDFATFAELLRMLDRYPYSVECKGGTIEFSARVVVITTQFPPEITWHGQSGENIGQLSRRIENVIFFKENGEASVGEEVYAGEDRNGGVCVEERVARERAEDSVRERAEKRVAHFNSC